MSKQNTSIEFEVANGDSIQFLLMDDGLLTVLILPGVGEGANITGLQSADLEALRRWIDVVELVMHNVSWSKPK